MERIEAVVIGAGIIGLAIAAALARQGREVIVLERESQFGTGISSRNSEVIHAGLHYPVGSLKERLCIEGRRQLYQYCETRAIAHRRCGKLVIAADAGEAARLDEIAVRGRAAGVDDLVPLDARSVRNMEPDIACHAALHSPSTGIVDSHALMLSLLGDAQDHGAVLARGAEAGRIERKGGEWRVQTGDTRLACTTLVNAAGLGAHTVARGTDALSPDLIPPLHLAKGSYFAYTGRTPFSRLIYPVPVTGGLGTHLTLDLAGQARFGPDVEWVDQVDFSVDPARMPQFLASARRIWPQIDPDRLAPAYAGIRPKLSGPGEPVADFMIQCFADHGLPGLVNLFGIESPGLTACLVIADHVASRAAHGL